MTERSAMTFRRKILDRPLGEIAAVRSRLPPKSLEAAGVIMGSWGRAADR